MAPIEERKNSSMPVSHNAALVRHTRTKLNKYTELKKRPIRDRIIQLLAVRPYKKPELFLALNRDGLKVKDRGSLMNILTSIATAKDNKYHLMKHIWNDVQEDWPFYTAEEKQMLKRRKLANLTQSTSSVHLSPPSASQPMTTAKRPGYFFGTDGLPTKKQRISHCNKPTPPNDDYSGIELLQDSSPLDNDILMSTTIKHNNRDQKQRDKEYFKAALKKYKQLQSAVEKLALRFNQLGERVEQEKASEEQITKENAKRQDSKKRFQYLNEKLSHIIERLINDYDLKNF